MNYQAIMNQVSVCYLTFLGGVFTESTSSRTMGLNALQLKCWWSICIENYDEAPFHYNFAYLQNPDASQINHFSCPQTKVGIIFACIALI